MRTIILIFFTSIMFYACTVTGHEPLSNKELEELKKRIIEKGDDYAYVRLGNHYDDQNKSYELLPYSIFISYKFNQGRNYNIYTDIVVMFTKKQFFETEDIAKLNSDQKEIALFFLNLGARKNDVGCVGELENLYRKGIGVDKNIQKADSLKKHLDSVMYKNK